MELGIKGSVDIADLGFARLIEEGEGVVMIYFLSLVTAMVASIDGM